MSLATTLERRPSLPVVLELFKPITWFPPMWAFGCGVVSSGVSFTGRWWMIVLGILLAGPLVCATSQAVNDWYDRHVDAVNEPNRPIPSGRMPGYWGLYIGIAWTLVSIFVATLLGTWVVIATVIGLVLAWIYSAPPIRLKRNGWWGNAAVGLSYEGLAWVTGAAVMLSGAMPNGYILLTAFLYSAGAHGIMTLNDFKSVEGDLKMGIDSLPAMLGVDKAARLACIVMAVPQIIVIALLFAWGFSVHALIVGAILAAQLVLMKRLLTKPRELAPWYGATGVSLYVLGMLVAAFALGAMGTMTNP